MKSRELIETMQVNISKSINYLNNGGCIHFAYYFSKALKSAGIPYKILLTNEEPIDIRYDYFDPVSHVMVQIPGIGYIDGYDFYPEKDNYSDQWMEERYSRHFLLSPIKMNKLRLNYTWNQAYRLSQNDKLEKIINRHVKKWSKKIFI